MRGISRRLVALHLLALLVVVATAWSVKAVRVYGGVARARAFWSIPHGPPGGLLYVALGDSSAQGVGASRPDRGYVGLLAGRLEAATKRPVEVINLSVSGARIEDVLVRQLPALRALRPDLVTVAIGGNDIGSYDGARFARQVDRLTAALPDGTFIADVPYFMHGRWEGRAQQAADAVRHSANRHGLPVVALHSALRRQGWPAMLTDFAADWFHPNDRGYRVWADTFWDRISSSPGGPAALPRRTRDTTATAPAA